MKLLKLFLCAAILASSINGVYAAENSGVAEALKQVKERVDTSEYSDFSSSYYQNDGEETVYNFSWSKGEDSSAELYISYQGGVVTNYSKYDYDNNDEAKAFSLDDAEAMQIAKEFIERINPDIYQDIVINPADEQSIQSYEYEFDIYRSKNGVPVLWETGYVDISKNTKEVSSFYINYSQGIEFKSNDSIISEDEAKAAYKKLITPTLRYNLKRDYSKKTITPYLEYVPKDSSLAINAYNGEVYKLKSGGDIIYNKSMMAREDAAADGSGFTPAEIEETDRIAGLLSEDDAIKEARNNEIIALPKNMECSYISLRKSWYDKNEYSYELSFEGDEKYISVRLDAKTGEILSFYNYSGKDNGSGQDRKTEEAKAKKAFSKLAGNKSAEYELVESEDTGIVSYVRIYNGLDVYGDSAYFYFDESDNITEYNLQYTKNLTFPEQDGVISPEDAAEKAFEQIGFGLAYVIDEKTAQPVYCLGKDGNAESFTMNPFSGNLTDYDGEDLKSNKKIEYSDIDNHYGKDIFLTLAKYGIGFNEKELKPDEPITQAEYFTLLNDAFGYYDDIEEIYSGMIRWGELSADERDDNGVLTREKAAIFMIRQTGGEEYAKYDDIFAQPFNDVTKNKGYIAILKAKKIVNGDGSGNFYPDKTVTRGEALIMIYNNFAN
ncbi:MAG: S-layer homology domain-containing protein [Clostridia bacterium]|nr:S-layer homology domain-containing protein [Clostridia bacterium]